jgi:hypothetical protein
LNNIVGISLSELPFPLERFIGDLFYHEFPVTSVYDHRGVPLVVEWLDTDEENSIDRYYAYQVPKLALKEFLTGKVSHWELMKSAIGGAGFIFEEDSKLLKSGILSCTPLNLPKEYVPSQDSNFIEEHAVDHIKIQNYFQLNLVEPPNEDVSSATQLVSLNSNSEIINLHLKSGNGIGYGKVNTNILGDTLVKFHRFYREIALDELLGRARGEIKLSSTNAEQKLITSTEVIITKAASYSIFIRPTSGQMDLFDGTTQSSMIANKINKIFKQAANLEEINSVYSEMSDYVFKAYKVFLSDIIKKELELNINWFNPQDQNSFEQDFNLTFANRVVENIKNISTQQQDRIELKGKFNRLHCDTGHFSLVSNQDEVFTGYFDVLLRDGMAQRNFISIYDIVINQSVSKEAGKAEPTIANTIISCIELTD